MLHFDGAVGSNATKKTIQRTRIEHSKKHGTVAKNRRGIVLKHIRDHFTQRAAKIFRLAIRRRRKMSQYLLVGYLRNRNRPVRRLAWPRKGHHAKHRRIHPSSSLSYPRRRFVVVLIVVFEPQEKVTQGVLGSTGGGKVRGSAAPGDCVETSSHVQRSSSIG